MNPLSEILETANSSVSNNFLSISALVLSVVSASLSIYEKISNKKAQEAQLKLECKKINYEHKLACYSELLSLLLHRDLTGKTNLDDYLLRLNNVTAQAKMFCSSKTLPYIDNLIQQLDNNRFADNGTLNTNFYNAFHECINAFRTEITPDE